MHDFLHYWPIIWPISVSEARQQDEGQETLLFSNLGEDSDVRIPDAITHINRWQSYLLFVRKRKLATPDLAAAIIDFYYHIDQVPLAYIVERRLKKFTLENRFHIRDDGDETRVQQSPTVQRQKSDRLFVTNV